MKIHDLLLFKNWADNIYLQYIKVLSESQFTEVIPAVNKSIKELIIHLFLSYWGDYHLLTDRDWSGQPNIDTISREQINSEIAEYNLKIVEFAKNNKLDEQFSYFEPDLDKEVTTTPENILFNFVTHSAYHRGQIALLLRYHGLQAIEPTDFNPYLYKSYSNS